MGGGDTGGGDTGGGDIAGGDTGDYNHGDGGGAVAHNATTRASRSWHTELVQTANGEDKQRVTENLRNAKEGAEKNKADKPFMEKRNLTLKVVVEAVKAMADNKPIDGKTLRMFEKDDVRLYGITVRDFNLSHDGTTVDGTRVKMDGNTWTVAGESRDGDGYKIFKLRCVEKCSRKQKGVTKTGVTILEILEHAEDGSGVVKLAEERERVNLVICVILCITYVQVHRFIANDPKIKKKRKDVELSTDERKEVLRVRKHAWDEVRTAAAGDTINSHKLALLASDEDLGGELAKAKSLFGFLKLDRFEAAGEKGLIEKPFEFPQERIPMVEHYIRGAQYAYRLGRVVCMESCMAPLSAGGDHTELPPGVELSHGETATIPFFCTNEEVRQGGYGLATRALLARARDSEGICKWYAHVPLYRLMLFSRPGKDMMPTSENAGR